MQAEALQLRTAGNLAAAEVYDLASGTWSATAPMASPHWSHTATPLPNGKVLVSGGKNGGHLTGAALDTP
jgi:hypothetical protein